MAKTLGWLALGLSAVLALGAGAAVADDPFAEAAGGWFRTYGTPDFGRSSDRCGGYRDMGCDGPRDACDSLSWRRGYCRCRPAYGTSWGVLRRYLADELRVPTFHRHPRRWWIRRWPVVLPGAYGWGDRLCRDTETAPARCAVVEAALAETDEELATADRLLRGLERFHLGAVEKAAEDFRAVTEADPKEARAWYGRAVSGFLAKDWKGTAAALRRLAALGELDGRDRFDAEGFADRERLASLADALATWTRQNFADVDAQLCCGWALLADGRPEEGRAHLRAALRWAEDEPAARRLLADGDVAVEAPAATAPVTPAPGSGPAPAAAAPVARAAAR